MAPLFPSPTSSPTAASNNSNSGLSGGQIAGIVVGSVLGALILLALLVGCCIFLRRRNRNQKGSVFNQISPSRSPAGMPAAAFRDGAPSTSPARYGIIGGRVARMSALERSGEEEPQEYDDSPESGLRVPPKRSGSLSSGSHLGAIAAAGGLEDESSPQTNSNGDYSSPEGVGSGQSEQLAYFKDYYSQDEIRPGDKVAVLWAYQPRANDEFELERGDMLKVVGIWDDGWATGVRLLESAEDWEEDRHNPQRDSGMSNGSSRSRDSPTNGEIKAFPLVCVCLPQHWRKTIEGESGEIPGASRDPGRPPSP
ncbi:MAG: hypothetical protein M1821_000406 [Bathelium mastoideum]|nr:MAG: hypothetical protein M1821_000406 [Bathelium mastoideum]KAI9686214.1 MAG: hypothetical protein M1822_003869 [Bathelium mastoideum]